ncbi:ABC transporter substrate-binding protein [Acidovorax cavernicola]|uniref:ABC transporter substrate-binding protein n=1 Tax=Acidovorax cavernicola TaxID=1675792 RepID=UPI00142D78A6|nr:ABC transporter substrate-binding protein [Acidovorax cavernicola]
MPPLVSNSSTTSAFVERYRSEGGKAHLFTPSSADVEQLSQRLGEEQMRGIVIAQVTPSPYKVTTALSKDFNDAFAKSKIELERSFTMIEGFIAGRVIVEAAQRIGRTPTREGMVAALNTFGPVDIGSYSTGFSPTSHVGSNYVELSIVNALGKVKQ